MIWAAVITFLYKFFHKGKGKNPQEKETSAEGETLVFEETEIVMEKSAESKNE